jgi:predicted amidohydrolase YtcJ
MKIQEGLGHPSLILENGIIFSGFTPAVLNSSVAILGNKIVAIGPKEELARLASNGTERVNLKGRSLLPGFVDSHTCFATDCLKVDQINLEGKVLSRENLAERLCSGANTLEACEWIVVKGYAEDPAFPAQLFSGLELDRIVPDRPAAIFSSAMDLCILNRMGIEALCVTRDAADVVDVQTVRDGKLKPTGRFLGHIEKIIPESFPCLDVLSLTRKMRKLGRQYIQRGITSIHDIDIFRAHQMAAYVFLRQENTLPIRVTAMMRGFPRNDKLRQLYLESGMHSGFGDAWVRLGAMKFSVDGFIGRQSAALSRPWGGVSGNYGQIYFSEEELVDKIRQATEAGFQVAFHTNGDRAIRAVIHCLKKAQALVSQQILRPRFHHCTLPDPEDIRQIKELGAIPIGHPQFIRFMGDSHLSAFGEERINAGYFPFRAFLNQGIPAVLSGEPILPLTRIDPMIGISSAVTRKTLKGHVLAPDQCITLEEAIGMYTYNPCYAAFEEERKGSIEVGKLADLVVLETDLREVEPDKLGEVKVEYTILNGKIVYSKA